MAPATSLRTAFYVKTKSRLHAKRATAGASGGSATPCHAVFCLITYGGPEATHGPVGDSGGATSSFQPAFGPTHTLDFDARGWRASRRPEAPERSGAGFVPATGRRPGPTTSPPPAGTEPDPRSFRPPAGAEPSEPAKSDDLFCSQQRFLGPPAPWLTTSGPARSDFPSLVGSMAGGQGRFLFDGKGWLGVNLGQKIRAKYFLSEFQRTWVGGWGPTPLFFGVL